MKTAYFFSINDQPVGPLDIQEIKRRIAVHAITRGTLAWCEGMDKWRPIQAIPELLAIFGRQQNIAARPPPLPGTDHTQGKATPPPLSGMQGRDRSRIPPEQQASAAAREQEGPSSDGLGKHPVGSYGWLHSVLPKSSPLRAYLERNPGMSTPVLMLALVGLLLILAFFIDMQTEEVTDTQQAVQQPGVPAGDWQSQYRIWQDAQRYNQGILDDVYKNQRDAENRMGETYRRGTYDWYNSDNN